MEFIEMKAVTKDKIIATFWVDQNGEVDEENLPCKREIALLLKTLKVKNVEIEFTGRIEND